MKSWLRIALGFLLIPLVLLVACGGETDSGIKQQMVTVTQGDLSVIVSGSGTVTADNYADITYAMGGKVEQIFVSEGDSVRKGDVLAQFETSALELAVMQAQSQINELFYNLNQLKTLYHASADRIALMEEQLETAQKGLAEAQKHLDEATITAPLGGVIGSVNAQEGDYVSLASMGIQPFIYLYDPDSLELEIDIDEVDIALIEPGQTVTVEIDALPDVTLNGTVKSVNILPKTQTTVVAYTVQVEIDPSKAAGIKVGMSADADITVAMVKNIVKVASRAVVKDENHNEIVKVLVGEEVETRQVVTGITDGLETEIKSGLSEGETAIIEIRTKADTSIGFY